jgi:hypothetical protein
VFYRYFRRYEYGREKQFANRVLEVRQMDSIGMRIKQAIESRGYTQGEVAKAAVFWFWV